MESIIKIKKLNIWYVVYYFIIYSFIGFILETMFGIFSKGMLESRQSFLFGPFCAIYGIGAVLMVIFLTPHKKSFLKIFLGSIIIGMVAEYLMSFICELLFNFKWWDYSEYFFNINGRVCLAFAFLWGILGIFLIRYFNPLLNKIIRKIKLKINKSNFNVAVIVISVFLVFDIFVSAVCLKMFVKKISNDFNMPITQNHNFTMLESFASKIFNEKYILKIYPNLMIAGTKYNNTFVDSLYPHVDTYYMKIFNK